MAKKEKRDILLISASAVGYYGFHDDELLDEKAAPVMTFLHPCQRSGRRLPWMHYLWGKGNINRFGIVLGRGGGANHMMIPLFRYWLGSRLGNGKQYFSWIHLHDLINIFIYQIENRGLSGLYNCTAPTPVTNRELTKAIANTMKKPLVMPPVPGLCSDLFWVSLAMSY